MDLPNRADLPIIITQKYLYAARERRVTALSDDPFDEKPRLPTSLHVLGQELDSLSVGELDARIAQLLAEIDRLTSVKSAKQVFKSAADAFFK